MDPTQDRLTEDESGKVGSLIEEMYRLLKDPKQDFVNVKELKAYLYYSDLYKKNPMAYKMVSDLEKDAATGLSLADFKALLLGAKLGADPPTIEQLCMVTETQHT